MTRKTKAIVWIAGIATVLAIVASILFPIEAAAIFIGLVTIVAALIVDSFKITAPDYFVERSNFGIREECVQQGLVFCLPVIQLLRTFSVVPRDIADKASFTTGNRQKLLVPFYVKHRVDEKLRDENGHNVYLGKDPEQILREIKAEIDSKLDALGGVETSDDIKANLKPIEDYLRCALQMESPPHTTHDRTTCGVGGCTLPNAVPGKLIIKYYSTHWRTVGDALRDEVHHPDEHSPLEKRCGVDVLLVRLEAPEYTPETEKALEAEEQEEARARGVKSQLKVMDDLIKRGVNPGKAIDDAQAALIGTNKTVRSFHGVGTAQAIVLDAGLPALGGGKAGKDDNGKKGGRR